MSPIHVVGIGASGAAGLGPGVLALIEQAVLLVGSRRHLSYFSHLEHPRYLLGDLSAMFATVQQQVDHGPPGPIIILASGDPLFFGLGRLLLTGFSAQLLTFHPHVSSVQLAFSRLKLPWQDAQVISVHGRSPDLLLTAIHQGPSKIAILTDPTYTPAAIATLLSSLDQPVQYQLWLCEDLGGPNEQVQSFDYDRLQNYACDPLNIVVLIRKDPTRDLDEKIPPWPRIGIPDRSFLTYSDRPNLITKREVRVLAIAELELQDNHIIWDIGAGTGSVAIEMAQLTPQSTLYAIEKTTAGHQLIQQNCQRFNLNNIIAIHGQAPDALLPLPNPDRIFIGGSSGQIQPILNLCQTKLSKSGIIVLAVATLETLEYINQWTKKHKWQQQMLQIQASRSVAIANMTRWKPLNPVILVKITPQPA